MNFPHSLLYIPKHDNLFPHPIYLKLFVTLQQRKFDLLSVLFVLLLW